MREWARSRPLSNKSLRARARARARNRGVRARRQSIHDLGSVSPEEYEKLSVLLVFACDEYEHDKLPNLRCAVKDGKLIADTFTALGFGVCIELYNEEVTKLSIDQAMCAMARRYPMRTTNGATENRIGRVFAAFIGHGTVDKTSGRDESYFCPYNFDPDRRGDVSFRARLSTLSPRYTHTCAECTRRASS